MIVCGSAAMCCRFCPRTVLGVTARTSRSGRPISGSIRARGALAVLSLEQPVESELLARILSTDVEVVMPPPASHKKRLTARQAETLRLWIEAGAPWGKHWAFERPVQIEPPKIAAHPIDAFVRARLAEEGLAPSGRASRHTLARRVSFDLTGLPPSTQELDEFLRDCDEVTKPSSETLAYERLVDRLLASEHFGERLAMWWLDAARYADTDGFQGNATRTNWPWRDWVVGAFNRNLPFDQFTIEQFAGDLLPNATPKQTAGDLFSSQSHDERRRGTRS